MQQMWQIKEMIALAMLAICAYTDIREKNIYLFYTGTATVKEAAVHFRGILPGFMVPRKLIQLEELPRLANGKTDMRTLADMMK